LCSWLIFQRGNHGGREYFCRRAKRRAYAPDMENGSENLADPKQTVRVLTIMLASE
jgi:hypothetical protein